MLCFPLPIIQSNFLSHLSPSAGMMGHLWPTCQGNQSHPHQELEKEDLMFSLRTYVVRCCKQTEKGLGRSGII